jgi:hypothetical protein
MECWLSTIILVTEDFAFKKRSYKAITEISRSQLTILMEVLYGIDVLLILNIEAWDWVAVYMT